ncbi:hypothetical protein BD311DRAFT_229773 [Dichomitus squalens]|uniref:Uncharacterized protein n=2 Tax=Dichomitus squalens TaxID=114155 RepID=A0A4Q9M602_9APHY|nr:hypothetical protein BD311DRAFT_229773 [Dichomitus squalens]
MSCHDVDEVYKILESLMVIHNILERFQDDPADIEDFDDEEDEGVAEVRGEAPAHLGGENLDGDLSNDELYATGLLRRKWLLNLMRSEL